MSIITAPLLKQDVLAKFDFDSIIKRMVDCGYIFENLAKRFSEFYGEEAGVNFTSQDIIYLITDILLSAANLSQVGNVTVCDMAMGASYQFRMAVRDNGKVTCGVCLEDDNGKFGWNNSDHQDAGTA